MKRRTFLLAGLGTGGALFLGWALLPPRQRLVGGTRPDTGGTAVALNGWVVIGADGVVTVVSPKAEMGQGITTALAMLVAEGTTTLQRITPARSTKLLGPPRHHSEELARLMRIASQDDAHG